MSLPVGKRELKFEALASLSLHGQGWQTASTGWRETFLANAVGLWATCPSLLSMFESNALGVMPGRTWVIAPDKETLENRWNRLIGETNIEQKRVLFHPHPNGDKTLEKSATSILSGQNGRLIPVSNDNNPVVLPVRYAMRSLDRQWIIPDNRILNRPNPDLWKNNSQFQIFATSLERTQPGRGPALTLTALVPDHDHFKGSAGGRVLPLWKDAAAKMSNISPALLAHLSESLGYEVFPEDVLAYVAALLAHPAFTARFEKDLKRPGLRVPLTADAQLFRQAAALGREVVWLHCYGERFADAAAGRPAGPPRMDKGKAPTIPKGGAIPPEPELLPETMSYDAAKQRLHIGKGFIDNVSPAMWAYEVSGRQVLNQWFSYRKRDRTRPQIGEKRAPSELTFIQPPGWLAEYTTDLLDLLNVLGRLTLLEPAQAALLKAVCEGPMISLEELQQAGVVPVADEEVNETATDTN